MPDIYDINNAEVEDKYFNDYIRTVKYSEELGTYYVHSDGELLTSDCTRELFLKYIDSKEPKN